VKTAADGKETVEEDIDSRDQTRHDIVALANVYFDHQYARALMFGAAFGVGQNSSGAPRYYLGPSVVLWRNFVFSGGLALGSVATLPSGQALGQAPFNGDNTLTTLGSRLGRSAFFSVAFTFINRESEFASAFGATSEAAGAGLPALAATDTPGDYQDENGAVKAKVAVQTGDGKTTIVLTLTDGNVEVKLPTEKGPLDYTTSDGTKEAKFSGTADAVVLQYSEEGIVKLTLKKTKKTS
jgi:hypothetical protein